MGLDGEEAAASHARPSSTVPRGCVESATLDALAWRSVHGAMADFFQELAALNARALEALNQWGTRHMKFSQSFTTRLLERMNWPTDRVARVTYETLPPGASLAPLGYVNGSGYHFGLCFIHPMGSITYTFLLKERSGSEFTVSNGDRTIDLDLNNLGSFDAIANDLKSNLRDAMLAQAYVKLTGFDA